MFAYRKVSGQGLVEIALILPLMLFALLAIIDFGSLMVIHGSLSTASRDAARYGASVGKTASGIAHYQDCIGIRSRAEAVTLFVQPTIMIEYDPDGPGGTDSTEYCQAGKDVEPIEASLGEYITVKATTTYEPLFSRIFIELPSFSLKSEASRTIVKHLYIK